MLSYLNATIVITSVVALIVLLLSLTDKDPSVDFKFSKEAPSAHDNIQVNLQTKHFKKDSRITSCVIQTYTNSSWHDDTLIKHTSLPPHIDLYITVPECEKMQIILNVSEPDVQYTSKTIYIT